MPALPTQPELVWRACTDDAAQDPTLECATLTVPLDYSQPSADMIEIALVRVPAQSDADRVGAVLFNPGGPGGSGFEYIAQAGTTMSSEMGLQNFDIIGFDPRGVDRSGGIRCLSDTDIDRYSYLDDTPDDAAEQALLDESRDAQVHACKEKYGDTLRFYSTSQTAKDMDQIRSALGDAQLSFIGVSYGTYLGAVYATMFPDQVRAMVLDSAYEPGGDTVEEQYKTQLVGFEGAFNDWAAWCAGNSECAFDEDSADVGAKWDALRLTLDNQPVVAADGRVANQSLLDTATFSALYSRSEWPVLGAALQDAENGDVAGLFRLADGYAGRSPDGIYNTIGQSNPVITCASGIEAQTPPDPAALLLELRAAAPRFAKNITAEDLTDDGGCASLMPDQPIDVLSYSGTAPIVVVGGENDPATPFRWAEEMTLELGPSAVLLRYTGEGHGQLLASTCVTQAEAAVIAKLTTPPPGTVCNADPEIAQPSWWTQLPVPVGIDDLVDSPELAAQLGLNPTDLFGEIRTSSLSADEAINAYTNALDANSFSLLGQQEPFPGVPQLLFQAPDGLYFSVLAIESEAMQDPQLAPIVGLIPAGKTLVVLLAIQP